MLGIYEDDALIKTYTSDKKASEFLIIILDELMREFEFEKLIYANGPGSYMGIKISFLTLKTLSIVKDIPLFAISAFELNNFSPIKANKNLCFVYENNEILLKETKEGKFFMPDNLQKLKLNDDNLPFYFLDVI